MAEDEGVNRKSFNLLKWNVSEVPCFRETFLYGISGGIGAGLLYFMFTSQIGKATHAAYGTFFVITVAYWTRCRYTHYVSEKNLAQLKTAIDRKLMYEGTAIEEQIEGKKEA